jgi:alpha-D-ribose 1-methylphosphonate 5-triphosphate diphosphatase PhnM
LADRGRIAAGQRADLLLVEGDVAARAANGPRR